MKRLVVLVTAMLLAWVGTSSAQSVPGNGSQGSATEALFDLSSPSKGPFPSDWFTVPDHTNKSHRRVSLPSPNCEVQISDCEDLAVLNELDGFNLLPRLSVPFSGPIDRATVSSDTVFLVSLGIVGPGHDSMPWGTVVGIDQVVWDTFANTLHVESDQLLAQHTRFALIVTRGVRDEGGARVGVSDAFLRFRATVRDDYKASLLEAVQAARQARGVRQEDIAVASVFTTQSATAVLEKIRDQIHAGTPEPADFLLGPNGVRTVFRLDQVTSIVWSQQTQVDPSGFTTAPPLTLSLFDKPYEHAVGRLAFGKYSSPDYQVHPGEYIPSVGTRTGTPAVQGTNDIYFNLFLPSGPEPAAGWPVVIYVHGVTQSKEGDRAFSAASTLAHYGIATISINKVGHGFGPESTLEVSRSDGASTKFLAGGRGRDQDGKKVITNTEGATATRPRAVVYFSDGYRQTAADLMQLVRVIEVGMDVDGDGQRDLDPSRVYIFGQSLGGGISTVFFSVEPHVRVGVLAVPLDMIPAGMLSCGNRNTGGALIGSRQPSLVNSPGITALDGCTLAPPLRFALNDNFPLKEQVPLRIQLSDLTTPVIQSPVTNTVPGAMAIQEAVEHLKWVGQAGSPLAHAPHIREVPLAGAAPKSVLFLIAQGDQSAPNPSTTAILRAGDLADRAVYYRHDLYRPVYLSLHPDEKPPLTTNPHTFSSDILVFGEITKGVLDMVGQFLQSDGDLPTVPESLRPFLEFPIPMPLPEGLNYIK